MTLKERIQTDKASAFKSGNRQLKDLLGTIIAESERKTKTPTDEEMVSIMNKFIENLKLCNDFKNAEYLKETYMPKELSNDNLGSIIHQFCIENVITEKRQMGLVMKFLKENFNGQYDGKVASTLISNILK